MREELSNFGERRFFASLMATAQMRLNSKKPLQTLLAFFCLVFFALICGPLFFNNRPYLDDYYLILLQKQDGFWAPTLAFQSMWGSYRLVYTTLMAPLYAMGDHLWVARTLGLGLHMANAWLIFCITGRLTLSSPARWMAFTLFVFFPYSLEAIAWPSNVTQYPFAPFFMLGGVALVLASTGETWKLITGALLVGISAWIHEQVGPLIILFLLILAAGMPKRGSLVFGVISLLIVAANFVLIYATRATNQRLSGEFAGTLGNVWRNRSAIPQLLDTTPFGRHFYATGGLSTSAWLWALAVLMGCWVAFMAVSSRNGVSSAAKGVWVTPKNRWFWLLALALALGAYAVTLIPMVMSPIPWHTARVVYIPFIGFTLAAGLTVEVLLRATKQSRIAVIGTSLLGFAVVVWSPLALRAEMNALNFQISTNYVRAQSFRSLLAAEAKVGNTVIVAGGYYDTDTQRPLFGEHFIGMTPAELKTALNMKMRFPPDYPFVVARSNLAHMCVGVDGRLSINASFVDPKTAHAIEGADRVTFAIWSTDRWLVQREDGAAISVPSNMVACVSNSKTRTLVNSSQ